MQWGEWPGRVVRAAWVGECPPQTTADMVLGSLLRAESADETLAEARVAQTGCRLPTPQVGAQNGAPPRDGLARHLGRRRQEDLPIAEDADDGGERARRAAVVDRPDTLPPVPRGDVVAAPARAEEPGGAKGDVVGEPGQRPTAPSEGPPTPKWARLPRSSATSGGSAAC